LPRSYVLTNDHFSVSFLKSVEAEIAGVIDEIAHQERAKAGKFTDSTACKSLQFLYSQHTFD
jgi:hypothetical protein